MERTIGGNHSILSAPWNKGVLQQPMPQVMRELQQSLSAIPEELVSARSQRDLQERAREIIRQTMHLTQMIPKQYDKTVHGNADSDAVYNPNITSEVRVLQSSGQVFSPLHLREEEQEEPETAEQSPEKRTEAELRLVREDLEHEVIRTQERIDRETKILLQKQQKLSVEAVSADVKSIMSQSRTEKQPVESSDSYFDPISSQVSMVLQQEIQKDQTAGGNRSLLSAPWNEG